MSRETESKTLSEAHAAARAGDVGRAIDLARKLAAAPGASLEPLHALAGFYGHAGRADLTIETCKRILAVDPGSARALSNLAAAHRMNREFQEAKRVSRQLIGLAPRDPSGHLNLGLALTAEQDFASAVAALETAVRLQPQLPFARLSLSEALQRAGEPAKAESVLDEAYRQFGQDRQILYALAKLKRDLFKPAQSVEPLQRLIEQSPNEPEFKLALAGIFDVLGLFERSEQLFREVVEQFPNHPEALTKLGYRCQELGKFDESIEYLERSLRLRPEQGKVYWMLVQGRKIGPEHKAFIERIHRALEIPTLSPDDRRSMLMALGKCSNDLGDFESAMQFFHAGNAEAEQACDPNDRFVQGHYREIFRQTVQAISPQFLAEVEKTADKSAKPIFIVGMMRSGTTLVEQILSSHSQICGAGELDYWQNGAAGVLESPPTELAGRAANATCRYLKLVNRLCPEAARVTDKMPHNFTILGLIHALLPNAKIIHCRRHPVDTCLSNYMHPLRSEPNFVHRLENLVEYYQDYEWLMGQWRSMMPADAMTEVVYEDLVENQEGETRRLIEFCGLDWEDACLHPEATDRPILTFSMWQVRQPVSSSSTARWRRYRPWLGPLAELLTDIERGEMEPC